MKADHDSIAANAIASVASPCAKVEIYWDAAWVDEAAYVIENISGNVQLTPPVDGLIALGQAPIGQFTVQLDNSTGRYSKNHAGSQAATFGIYSKQVRVSLGYKNGGTNYYEAVFTGRTMGVTEGERSQQVPLTCHDMGAVPMQQKVSSLMYTNQRTDLWMATCCSLAGISSFTFETGLCVIPWCFLDDDYALDDLRRVAMSEGGVAFFDTAGVLRFWNAAHWCGAASVATYTVATFAEVEPVTDYDGIYNIIGVEYQPRLAGQARVVHSLKRAIEVPPSGTKAAKLKFQWPLVSFTSYDMAVCSGGAADMAANVTPSPTTPNGAQSWDVTFTNNHATQAAFVTKFDVLGVPAEGRPAETYEEDQSGAAIDRRRDIRGNYYLQTETQAQLVAAMLAQRLKVPRMTMHLRDMRGNPLMELGDLVTVQATLTGLNKVAMITGISWRFADGAFKMDLDLVDFTDLYLYTGYLLIGTAGLNSGRLFY